MRYRTLTFVLVLALAGAASASSINQNTSWTIERAGAEDTYRVVAYGDSIFAGYRGDLFDVVLRSSPYVVGEYGSVVWNGNVEVVRRTKSGAVAQEIYDDKIDDESQYMADAGTRVVMFEMCGNDYLQARQAFAEQTGTCDTSALDAGLASCTTYMEKAMQKINTTAPADSIKLVANIYYPGYAAENAATTCTDKDSGSPPNMQDLFIGYLTRGNWRACHFAEQYGFLCVDSFAQIMGSDYDTNGDGVIDSEGLRYKSGESEDDYVTRITQTLRSTLIDANTHFTDASTSYDYIFSDDIHPTPYTDAQIALSYDGDGSGSGAAAFADASIVAGKNPMWNQYGHERFGWTAADLAFPQPQQQQQQPSSDPSGTTATPPGNDSQTPTDPGATPDNTPLGIVSEGSHNCSTLGSENLSIFGAVGLFAGLRGRGRRKVRSETASP